MEIQQVKNDLYNLRKTIHSVAVMAEVRKRQFDRLDIILCMPDSDDKTAEVDKMQHLIDLLSVASVSTTEQRYMTAINTLELIDKTIILDWLMNGKPYWKIGREVGYSESTIRYRMKNIFYEISKIL